ncbi:predicted protein [Naegleria gruberi]|uniref:Predicted protein n=1 Tax=Naegleria gruberi TaxID=5762 RepID=D2VK85_NAEGR|nr:uncharacterized protein NAEGRDRAFT_69305 [Naegleria gruberi]EFC42904.1 predicted protein [Naegleria gruberi]|eukprot:XP_002675648.1 predicted protein [Naegleria gruberi strain NEG-M]
MFGFPSSSNHQANNNNNSRLNINTSPNNPFSLSSLAVDISSSSFIQSPTQGSHHSGGTPDWLSSSIPMTSPSESHHLMDNSQQLFQKHDDDEEPQWLSNSNDQHEDDSVFSPNGLRDEEHQHQTNTVHNSKHQQHSIKTPNHTHDSHHPFDIYEIYSDEYDEGVLLSENHFFRQILHPIGMFVL